MQICSPRAISVRRRFGGIQDGIVTMRGTFVIPVLIGCEQGDRDGDGITRTTDEGKDFCELTGGDFGDDGAGGFDCYYDGWSLTCDGTTCVIFCWPDAPCIEDQKVVEPTTTPTPNTRDRVRSTTADQPMVVEPVTTPTPPTRGRGRSTTADEPMVVAPLATPGPTPIVIIESPTFDPAPVMIDP